MLKKEKIYVPKNEKLRIEIIWLYHDMLIAGYGEKQKITELVTKNYQWPGVTRDIGRYMKGCDICRRMKNRMEVLVGKLKLSEVPEKL